MLRRISLTTCRVLLSLAFYGVVCAGYSVQAEQSNRTLYTYVMDTYNKQYVDTEDAKKKLSKLQEQYQIAEGINTQAKSFESLKQYSEVMEKNINTKIDEKVSSLQKEQVSVSKNIEDGILSMTPMQLSTLNHKYSKFQEDIDSALGDKTSMSTLFNNPTYSKVDTSDLELSIKQQQEIISYDSSNNNTDFGSMSELRLPFKYAHIVTSPEGYRVDPIDGTIKFHDGTDYGVPMGTEVYSLFNGTVVSSGVNGGYGESIKIDCGNGIILLYAHLSRRDVKVGDKVKQNQLIALSGNTGRVTGPHLHLSLFYKGEVLDVERLFR